MLQISPRDSLGGEPKAPEDETHFWRVTRHGDLDFFTATFRKHVFPPHTHETYVIGVTLDGVHSYMHKGVKVRCEAGNICFINPEEVHDGAPDSYGYSYRMTYPSSDFLTSLMREATGRSVGTPKFRWPGVRDLDLARIFCDAHRALESDEACVAEIATHCGFKSSTTFAIEYRKRFGMAPSRTKRAARSR